MMLAIPYNPPKTPDQQSANNIYAMMQLMYLGRAPSVANQVKRHIRLVHIVQDHTMRSDCVY
jgi:hypothetical protein